MSIFWQLFHQVGRHIKRELRLSIGSFLVLLIVLILIDFFWIASATINSQYQEILRNVRMELFLSDALPDSALVVIANSLKTSAGVGSVQIITKDDAARILESDLGPGIFDGLGENPLPRSIVIHFDRMRDLETLDAMQARLLRFEGVDAIEFGRPWIEKVENAGRAIKRAGYIIGGLILLVVLLTMANTNRLTARSKSHDLFQLQLLGAGPPFMIYPFLIEGFLAAFMAAALGWGAMYYATGKMSFVSITLIMPAAFEIAIYAVLAGLVGGGGAWLGIRRFIVAS